MASAFCPLCQRKRNGEAAEQCSDCGHSYCHRHIAWYGGGENRYLCRSCAARLRKAGRLNDGGRVVRPSGY